MTPAEERRGKTAPAPIRSAPVAGSHDAHSAEAAQGHGERHKKKPAEIVRGRVRQFLLAPHGEVDGLLLDDGLQVATPPHLAARLIAIAACGDEVEVHGHRESAARVAGTRIVNLGSGQAMEEHGPPKKPAPHGNPAKGPRHVEVGQHDEHAKHEKHRKHEKHEKHDKPRLHHDDATVRLDATGTIAVLLHGKHGEINGAVLDDTSVLRFPRHTSAFYADLLVVGNRVDVRGMGVETPQGRVVHAQEMHAR